MRLLLDENVPEGLRLLLPDHDVRTVQEVGLAGISNGELLDAAEKAGFDALLTGDKNIPHQQRLAGRKLAIVALGTQHWPTLRANPQPIRDALARAGEGAYVPVAFPRPRCAVDRRRSRRPARQAAAAATPPTTPRADSPAISPAP